MASKPLPESVSQEKTEPEVTPSRPIPAAKGFFIFLEKKFN
jgi:hypothetical protein